MKIPRERRPQIAIAVIAFAALFATSRLLDSIDIQKALHDVSNSLGAWTYAVVGLAAFLETGAFVGLVLPGESVVILGGAVAGQGATSVVVTIAVVWACAFAGDSASFVLGRRLGKAFILRHGPKLRITEERFEKVESYFSRYGGRTILVGRFIGLVRALAPFTAGSSGMGYRNFFPYSLLGTGLWSATFSLLGYFASKHLNAAANAAGKSTLYFGLAVALIVGLVMAVRYLREAENRAHLEARLQRSGWGRSLLAWGRRLRPHARFVLARVTPGDLGLELTALLSAVAVGAFVVIAQATSLQPTTGALAMDRWAFDALDAVRSGWLDELAKVVTGLGSTWATVAVGVVGSAMLAARRRWAEMAVLFAGLVVVTIASDSVKAAVDRQRPPDPLVNAALSSYPSGHAAHAIVYPYLAFLVAFRGRLQSNCRRWVIGAGIAVALLIGISRVYLRVHYASDVFGGWALGVAVFAVLAAIALVATHLRRSGDEWL